MADTLNSLVGQTSGGLPDRVAALNETTQSTTDLLNQLVDMQSKMDKLSVAQQNVPGVGDAMRSPAGILTALGSIGSAALGEGQAGAGVLEGFIADAGQKQATEQALLGEKRTELIDMLDKQRQRLISVYQANPMAFVDAETGLSRVDPRAFGYAMTGFVLPIDPGVNYTLAKQEETLKYRVGMGMDLLTRGETPEAKMRGGRIVNEALGLNLDEQFFLDVSTMNPDDVVERLLANPNLDQGHTLAMWRYMRQTGKTIDDPETVAMLAPAMPTQGNVTIDETMLGAFANLSQEVEKLGPAVQALNIFEQIDAVYGGSNEGLAALMVRHLKGTDAWGTGIDGVAVQQQIDARTDLYRDIWVGSKGKGSQFLRDLGVNTEEDIPLVAGRMVLANLGWTQRALADIHGQDEGNKMREVALAVSKENPNFTDEECWSKAGELMAGWKSARGVTSPTGRLDVQKYHGAIKTFVDGAKAPGAAATQ